MHSLLALLVIGFFSVLSTSSNDPQPEVPPTVIGTAAPTFSLTDLQGNKIELAQYKGKIVVLEWVNPFCPYSRGQYNTGNMQQLQKRYTEQGVVWLTINSTNPMHANARSNEEFAAVLSELKSSATANLRDADGIVGKMYDARTTPHMFVIDKNGVLAYTGAIDDDRSTEGGANAKINYVAQAIDELQAGKSVSIPETKPYGCSVKY
jgi:peroxiredoxin